MSDFVPSKMLMEKKQAMVRPFVFTGEISTHHYDICEARVKAWMKNASPRQKQNFDRIQDLILSRLSTASLYRKDRAHAGQLLVYLRRNFYFVDGSFIYEVVFKKETICGVCDTKVCPATFDDYIKHLHAGYCPLIVLQPTLGVFHGDVKFLELPESFDIDDCPGFTEEELQ